MTEIDREHFCVERSETCMFRRNGCRGFTCSSCHRKWPAPEQFEQEYGRKPEGMPFYYLITNGDDFGNPYYLEWEIGDGGYEKNLLPEEIVIACTPYGKPDNDWRPE